MTSYIWRQPYVAKGGFTEPALGPSNWFNRLPKLNRSNHVDPLVKEVADLIDQAIVSIKDPETTITLQRENVVEAIDKLSQLEAQQVHDKYKH